MNAWGWEQIDKGAGLKQNSKGLKEGANNRKSVAMRRSSCAFGTELNAHSSQEARKNNRKQEITVIKSEG